MCNAKERVFQKLAGKETDRIPNLNIVMLFAAREAGVSFRQYCRDHEALARGNMLCAQRYGIDVVTTMSDPMREAHDLGTEVEFPEDDVPYARVSLLADKSRLTKLKPVEPSSGPRMTETVQAIEFYKRETGNDYPVIGWVEGCFAEAADLRGVNEFLIDLYDDPEFIRALLEFCLEQAILYAQAQVRAGADIIGVGDAIASVAGPNAYQDLAGEYERRLLTAIREMGAKTKLHICGNTQPFLEWIPFDVVDIFDVDWMVPLEEVRKYSGTSVLSGNYDPVAVLLQGTPESVRRAAEECAQKGGTHYISSAGCEVPKFTPPENLLAVKEYLESR